MGLLKLVHDVRARFKLEGTPAEVLLGAREVTKQVNQGAGRAARVVFVPIGGRYAAPRNPGRNPRPLATWLATAEVHVWGYDGTKTNDEEAQIEAAWTLHDAVVRAIYLAAHGTFTLDQPKWNNAVVERTFGKEMIFTLSIECPVMDTPYPEVPGSAVTAQGSAVMQFPDGHAVDVCSSSTD